jgi:hypothetical protein
MVSGDTKKALVVLSGKKGRLLKVEDLKVQHLAEEVTERPSSSDPALKLCEALALGDIH